MKKCTEITLSGKRCREDARPSPVTQSNDYCYFHGKVADGLTDRADAFVSIEEDED